MKSAHEMIMSREDESKRGREKQGQLKQMDKTFIQREMHVKNQDRKKHNNLGLKSSDLKYFKRH